MTDPELREAGRDMLLANTRGGSARELQTDQPPENRSTESSTGIRPVEDPMRRSRFTEERPVGVPKEHEAGAGTAAVYRKRRYAGDRTPGRGMVAQRLPSARHCLEKRCL